ncbi:MAG TPA: hypothetical protein VGI10_18540 [Polyangiaceae bacterium]|jgi:hypothetical protein
MSRLIQVASALAVLALLLCEAPPVSAKDGRRVLFLRQTDSVAEAILAEALRIQLAGSAELIELRSPATSAEATAAQRSMHAELVVWLSLVNGSSEGKVAAVRASDPTTRLEIGPEPSDPATARTVALQINELLDSEPQAVVPPASPYQPPMLAFVEIRGAATFGGTPSFWLPSIAFASGPRFQRVGGFAEAYGLFALDANVRSVSRIGEVDASLAYFGAGGRVLRRWEAAALGPYLELGVVVLRARGLVDPKHTGGAELRVPVSQLGLEARIPIDSLELRGALGAELWFERQRLSLRATPVLDFGRVRPAISLSAVLPLF